MKLFFFKSISIIMLMFLCVLIGMQVANEGIQKTRGVEDARFKPAFLIQKAEAGEVKTSILGTSFTKEDLKKKQFQLERVKERNLFSSIGTFLSDQSGHAINFLLTRIFGAN